MLTVRKAVRSDIEDLLRLDTVAARDEGLSKKIRRWVKKGQARVAVLDAVVVGYGVLNHSFFGHPFIAMLYVDPAHRFNGIGAALMTQLERSAKTGKIFASASQSNASMKKLLSKLGYEISGIIQNLDVGGPELIYSKQLPKKS
jgi:ribosomal protein S18 acetylase RimI-like enzyme